MRNVHLARYRKDAANEPDAAWMTTGVYDVRDDLSVTG